MRELYYQDAYLKVFDAVVEEVIDEHYILLNHTAFYPQGGGQPSDIGILIRDGETFIVEHVKKENGKIVHEVTKHGLEKGDSVKGQINWEKRHKLMKMHTAAHVVSAVMHLKTGALITGNQLGEELTRIDFSLENFDREKIQNYVDESNRFVQKDLPVKSYFITKKEAENIEQLSKLAKGLPEHLKDIRIVEIEGLDKQGDGGTHVKSLKEVGEIVLEKIENKGSKNRRLYFSLR